VPDSADHLDRCWLEVSDKRNVRQLGDRIGLAVDEAVTP
jgi:hypothetical protein